MPRQERQNHPPHRWRPEGLLSGELRLADCWGARVPVSCSPQGGCVGRGGCQRNVECPGPQLAGSWLAQQIGASRKSC